MAKIDKRKKYIMVVDTETANNIEYPVVYDLGIAITDKTGKIYESYSFVISDVYDIPGLMETAYYKEKIATDYKPGLASGKYHKVSFSYALDKMMELSQKYDIKQFSAYNVNFDLRALNNTAWTYLGYELDFSSYDIVCIQELAASTLMTQKGYARFCQEHSLLTDKGWLSQKAENVYRYLLNCPTYVEEHTGLADVQIEVAIMARAYRQKKKVIKGSTNYQFLNKFHGIACKG